MIDVWEYVHEGKLFVRVIPNASKTEINGWDAEKKQLKIRVNSPPSKGKANMELESFLSKLFGKKVKVVKGMRSRDKIFQVL